MNEVNSTNAASRHRYIVKSVIHADKILAAFESESEVLRLRDVVSRTGFNKGICFRLLYTLVDCGFLKKVGPNQYQSCTRKSKRRTYRIGFGTLERESSFSQEVLAGISRAAEAEGVELILVDNRYNPKVAMRNADKLVHERVDLVIEFQTDAAAAPAIAQKYLEANIPLIAVDIPHPGATYFGVNHYEAGLLGGRCLGQFARQRWQGQVDSIILIGISQSGHVVALRTEGFLAGIRHAVPVSEGPPIYQVACDGSFKTALDLVRKYLRASKFQRVLIGASTDPAALAPAGVSGGGLH